MVEQTREVRREVRIEARPEIVYSYFTDPAKMVRWKGIAAELEPRPGGIYRVRLNDDVVARGEFVTLEPPHRLVFSWGWENTETVPPGASTVEVTLTPDGSGTLVRLRHSGLPAAETEQFGQGWDHFLPRLVVAAAGGDPEAAGAGGPSGSAATEQDTHPA